MVRRDISVQSPMRCMLSRQKLALVLVILGFGLSACDRQRPAMEESLARVNGEEITAHHLRSELLQADSSRGASTQQVLERLIDRQLLQSEAVRNKLDRDPSVRLAIESAKADILAQAYIQSRQARVAKPSKADVTAYFNQHPELFSKRKLFATNEIAIEASHVNDQLNAVMDAARSLDDVAAWLEGQRIAYTHSKQMRMMSDLPPAMASKLDDMKKGQMWMVKDGASAWLLALVDIQDSPVTIAAATAQIERELINQKLRENGAAEVARLRSVASVEYLNRSAAQTAQAAGAADTRPAGYSSAGTSYLSKLQMQ